MFIRIREKNQLNGDSLSNCSGSNCSGSDSYEERGVSLVEFAILLPFLSLTSLWVVDLSTGLINYMALSQIVREGVRIGTTVPELAESGLCILPYAATVATCGGTDYDTEWTTCTSHPSGNPDSYNCGHVVLQKRIVKLYGYSGDLGNLDEEDLEIDSYYVLPTTAAGTDVGGRSVTASDNDMVRVEVRTRFNGIFFEGFPMSISQVGPYLSRSS